MTLPTAGDRIIFSGSPWPEGHAVAEFEWTAFRRDGEVWFGFHLETARYDAERAIEDDGVEYESDWQAPIVWTNYHACTLSTSKWHDGGFRIGPTLTLDAVDGLELVVDSPPPEDTEENACHVYLLGHDAVADHRIRFTRIPGPTRSTSTGRVVSRSFTLETRCTGMPLRHGSARCRHRRSRLVADADESPARSAHAIATLRLFGLPRCSVHALLQGR